MNKYFILLMFLIVGCSSFNSSKEVIGYQTQVKVGKEQIPFDAKVSTGSSSTSINGEIVKIYNKSKIPEENVGKPVTVKFINKSGEDLIYETKISKWRTVYSPNGSKGRYYIPLTISLNGVSKEIVANISNRANLRESISLGRDFLSGSFLVDVEKQ